MSDITPVNEWPATFVVIDDGDLCSNAEHLATAQRFANALTHLREGIPGKAATLTLEIPLIAIFGAEVSAASDRFQLSGTGQYTQDDITTAGQIIFRVPLQPFGVLQSVNIVIDGTASHGALPGTMPTFKLERLAHTIGSGSATNSQLGSTITDPSASVAAYEVPHVLSIDSLAHTIDANSIYHVEFTGEAGANAVVNLSILRLYAVITAT